jgi:hypothetical protein
MADELTKMRAERCYIDAKAERLVRMLALMERWRRLESCADLADFVEADERRGRRPLDPRRDMRLHHHRLCVRQAGGGRDGISATRLRA